MSQPTVTSQGRFFSFYLRKLKGRISLPCIRRNVLWSYEITFRFSTSRISHYLIALPVYYSKSTPSDLRSGQFSGTKLCTGVRNTSLETSPRILLHGLEGVQALRVLPILLRAVLMGSYFLNNCFSFVRINRNKVQFV